MFPTITTAGYAKSAERRTRMKDTKSFKAYMALLVTVAVIGFLYLITYVPIPLASKDAALLVLGAILMRVADVFGYYFGSSEGSQRKTEIMGATNANVISETKSQTTTSTDTPAVDP